MRDQFTNRLEVFEYAETIGCKVNHNVLDTVETNRFRCPCVPGNSVPCPCPTHIEAIARSGRCHCRLFTK